MARPKGAVTLERERRQLEATAYHEAGHAVMAFVLLRKIRRVHIHRDDSVDPARPETLEMISLGQTEFAPLPKSVRLFDQGDPRNRAHAEVQIMISLAGAMAQGRFYNRHSWVRMSATDRKAIGDLATIHCGGIVIDPEHPERIAEDIKEATAKYVEWLACRTRILIAAHWPIVEAVAAALVERRELTGREVETIACVSRQPAPAGQAIVLPALD